MRSRIHKGSEKIHLRVQRICGKIIALCTEDKNMDSQWVILQHEPSRLFQTSRNCKEGHGSIPPHATPPRGHVQFPLTPADQPHCGVVLWSPLLREKAKHHVASSGLPNHQPLRSIESQMGLGKAWAWSNLNNV